MGNELELRVSREKIHYNQGLKRKNFNKIMDHANHGPAYHREKEIIYNIMADIQNKDVLELGSQAWAEWFDLNLSYKITCINISEAELQKGIDQAVKIGITEKIDFIIMDAHDLKFPDNTFDLIFGSGILHHLDFNTAVNELYRVLKPGGHMIFHEPLRLNPVSKLVRFLTPNARTQDEKPLGMKELKYIKEKFFIDHQYFQLFIVPVSILSRYIFKNPVNFLTKGVDHLDIFLGKLLPFLRPFHRYILMKGTKRV